MYMLLGFVMISTDHAVSQLSLVAVLLELPVELVELVVLLLFNPTMIPTVKLKEETG